MTVINWKYYPTYHGCPKHMEDVAKIFEKNENIIVEVIKRIGHEHSNAVLELIRADLENLDDGEFEVEITKKGLNALKDIGISVDESASTNIICRPVLYGDRGKIEKSYEVDAYCEKYHTILEVEGGRATLNYQYLKDIFESCLIIDAEYLIIAVRNIAREGTKKCSFDYEEIIRELDALYASDRMSLPLKGIMIIGY